MAKTIHLEYNNLRSSLPKIIFNPIFYLIHFLTFCQISFILSHPENVIKCHIPHIVTQVTPNLVKVRQGVWKLLPLIKLLFR